MNHLRYPSRKALALVSVTALAACAPTLLWETTHNPADTNIIYTSALTNSNGLLLSAGQRSDSDASSPINTANVLHYDSDGSLINEQALGENSVASSIYPSGFDVFFITGAELTANQLQNDQEPNELWLASKTAAFTPLKVLDLGDDHIVQAVNVGDLLYIATSTGNIQAIDMQGNVMHTSAVTVDDVLSLDHSPNQTFYASNENAIYAFDNELNLLSEHSFSSLGIEICLPQKTLISFDSNSDLIVHCINSITKIDSDTMQPLFNHTFSDLFASQNSNGVPFYFEHPIPNPNQQSPVVIDEEDNIYWVGIRNRVYVQDVGGLTNQGSGSSLRSETLIVKLDGDTGDRVWSNDISGQFFPTEQGLLSSFYYPLSQSVVGNELQVTFKGFTGEYEGDCSVQINTDSFFILSNYCDLTELTANYARTQYFDLNTGDRRTGTRYEIPFTDSALVTQDGAIMIVGDQAWEGSYDITTHIPLAGEYDEYPSANLKTSASNIVIQKHSL